MEGIESGGRIASACAFILRPLGFFLKCEGRFVVILSLLRPVRGLIEYIQLHYLRVTLEMVTNAHARMLLLWELQSQDRLSSSMLLDVA
jgi:hypothetical protein